MLPIELVREICRMLDEGELSQRKIAAKLGVSRGTVGALATGRRGRYGREPDAEQEIAGPPQRCGGCGMKVTMPCVYCRAVDYRLRKRTQASANPAADRRAA
ncbi:MAG: hypothetical protein AAF790_02805 [Planctomycetota bacterium]